MQMHVLHCGRIVLTLALAGALILLGPTGRVARAELVPTAAVLNPAGDQSDARERVLAFLDREDVRGQLEALGVSSEEAKARVASLTDDEVERINGKLDQLPAGGDFLALAASILVVTVLVLLFADLLGFTDIFPFVNPLPRGEAKPRR
jgi:hypothetical protein